MRCINISAAHSFNAMIPRRAKVEFVALNSWNQSWTDASFVSQGVVKIFFFFGRQRNQRFGYCRNSKISTLTATFEFFVPLNFANYSKIFWQDSYFSISTVSCWKSNDRRWKRWRSGDEIEDHRSIAPPYSRRFDSKNIVPDTKLWHYRKLWDKTTPNSHRDSSLIMNKRFLIASIDPKGSKAPTTAGATYEGRG